MTSQTYWPWVSWQICRSACLGLLRCLTDPFPCFGPPSECRNRVGRPSALQAYPPLNPEKKIISLGTYFIIPIISKIKFINVSCIMAKFFWWAKSFFGKPATFLFIKHILPEKQLKTQFFKIQTHTKDKGRIKTKKDIKKQWKRGKPRWRIREN